MKSNIAEKMFIKMYWNLRCSKNLIVESIEKIHLTKKPTRLNDETIIKLLDIKLKLLV